MKKGLISILLGSFWIIWGFLGVILSFEPPSYLLFVPVGMIVLVDGIFTSRGYYNKTYFMAVLSIITFLGVILAYIYMFMPVIYTMDRILFYMFTGIFVLYVFIFTYYYYHRKNNLKTPWKDEWGI